MASSATLSYRLLGLGLGLGLESGSGLGLGLTLTLTLTMVAPGYGYGIVTMAALGYGGPWLRRPLVMAGHNHSTLRIRPRCNTALTECQELVMIMGSLQSKLRPCFSLLWEKITSVQNLL